MADSVRLKLLFVNPLPFCPQFVWFLMNLTSCSVIADLCGAIKKRFFEDLRGVKLDLTMDDCALLPQEDIHLLKDNDTIRYVGPFHMCALTYKCRAMLCYISIVYRLRI